MYLVCIQKNPPGSFYALLLYSLYNLFLLYNFTVKMTRYNSAVASKIGPLDWFLIYNKNRTTGNCCSYYTGDEGFEPPSTVLETGALPLH